MWQCNVFFCIDLYWRSVYYYCLYDFNNAQQHPFMFYYTCNFGVPQLLVLRFPSPMMVPRFIAPRFQSPVHQLQVEANRNLFSIQKKNFFYFSVFYFSTENVHAISVYFNFRLRSANTTRWLQCLNGMVRNGVTDKLAGGLKPCNHSRKTPNVFMAFMTCTALWVQHRSAV